MVVIGSVIGVGGATCFRYQTEVENHSCKELLKFSLSTVAKKKKVKLSLTQLPMQTCWNVPVTDSGVKQPELAAGEPPPLPHPPDPPDPTSPLSPVNFPSLSAQPSTVPKRLQRKGSSPFTPPASSSILGAATTVLEPAVVSENGSVGPEKPANIALPQSPVTLSETISETVKPSNPVSELPFTTFPPKSSSPILTNSASGSHLPAILPTPSSHPIAPVPTVVSSSASPSMEPPIAAPSLVEKLRAAEDKTLKRLAPVSFSASGLPRVIIPDAFYLGAATTVLEPAVVSENGSVGPEKPANIALPQSPVTLSETISETVKPSNPVSELPFTTFRQNRPPQFLPILPPVPIYPILPTPSSHPIAPSLLLSPPLLVPRWSLLLLHLHLLRSSEQQKTKPLKDLRLFRSLRLVFLE
ncbi:hypothetical protein Bca52824_018722 [Brassica carinata]|uniref:Uncharacterized protein n=1 Tax=Brassica carinata TaxID=52824 RepID=A0A8X7VRH8_BRACI|nr:hypothetical protein Bca52824_018722 [Brassica carinata]